MQIAQKIIGDIQSGRFTPGVALPGTRDLANKIKVNRKTVIQAYDELISEGWLISESKRGTFVSPRVLTVNHQNKPPLKIQHRASLPLSKEVTPILSKRQEHDFIHFSEGLPDVRLLPFEMLSRAMRHALIFSARNNKSAYGDPKGSMILREAILQMLNMERGLHANIENLCIVRGSQMGVFLTARVFIETGDCVVVEQLTNPLAREAFKSCGASIVSVAHDNEGIDVDNLELLCGQHKIRAVYVTPHHQIPTTVCMSQERRKRLLALAEQYDFLIIEDDSDYEFNFSQKVTLPLASIQKSNRVIYIGSLSKVLAPGFRIGYIVAPKEIIHQCANQVTLIDRQGDIITELAIAELLHTGEIKRHNLRTLKIYEERSTFISSLIHNELSEFVSFRVADSGLAIWLEINKTIDMNILISDAESEKISITAGANFSSSNNQISAIRLGFANLNNDEIRSGIKRLKAVFLNQQTKLLRA
ncbi:MAG: PLP-dependent aminotransferase family protein [Methylotenera sp.]|nr:PLP-dependent aminotransferase family protein [Methylotenera sp.]